MTLAQIPATESIRTVVITGGRTFNDRRLLSRALDRLRPQVLIHGDARGADRMAAQIAAQNGAHVEPFPANWDPKPGGPIRYRRDGTPFDPTGGHARNSEMMAYAAEMPTALMCLAMPGGAGTANAVKAAQSLDIPVWQPATGIPMPDWRPPAYMPFDAVVGLRQNTRADGSRSYTTPVGECPSITTVLSATMPHDKRRALAAWRRRVGDAEADRIRDDAAKRGAAVHAAIETFLDGEEPSLPPEYAPYWSSIKPELERLLERGYPLFIERPLYHPEARIAGTADALFELDGEIVIVDWKTKSRRPRDFTNGEHGLQLSAYGTCVRRLYGMDVRRGLVVTAVGDGGPAGKMMVPRDGLARGWGEFLARRWG